MRPSVLSSTLAIIAAFSVPVAAEDSTSTTSEAPDTDKVVVDGFGIQPMGNIASTDDAVVVHPKALLGFGYDSNIFATQTNIKGSAFWDLVAGVDGKWVPNQEDKLVLSAEFEGQKYLSQSGRNLSGGLGVLSYRHSAERWEAGGVATVSRTNDPLIVTGQEIKHDDYALQADVSRHSEVYNEMLGVSFDRTHYLEGSPGIFARDYRNSDLYGVNVRLGKVVGDDSEYYLRAVVDHRTYDQGTFAQPVLIPGTSLVTTHGYNTSTGLTALAGGWKHKIGTRSGLILELGPTYRSYYDNFEGDPNFNDRRVVNLAADMRYRWNYEVGSWWGARAYSTIEDSVFSNAARLYGVMIDTRYRLKADEQAALFGQVSGYELVDSGGPKTASEPDAETRTTLELSGGAEYMLEQGLGIRLKDVFDDSHSKYFNSFRRDVIELEVAFVY